MPVDSQHETPTRVYLPTITKIPEGVVTTRDAFVKKQQVVENKLRWHPDNLTMDELVQVLRTSVDPFYPSRGVEQGDPLSSMLFVLTIEPLAQILRNQPENGYAFSYSGIAFVLLFADDNTLISSSVGDLESQLELVD
ncbi:unnamed protein product, partial [Aphanomyces euteiches]